MRPELERPEPERLLHDTLRTANRVAAERVAIHAGPRTHTYGELWEDAQRLAAALQVRGLSRGQRVVLYLENSYTCCVAIYGVLIAGGVFVVVNPQTKADKLAYVLHDCEAQVAITEKRLSIELSKALEERALVKTVLCAEPVGGKEPATACGLVPLEDLGEVLSNSAPAPQTPPTIACDLAALIYTSGSTGQPKGVMMTHQSMLFTVYSLLQYLRLDNSHRIVAMLPLAFDYGLYQLLMAVAAGATLILERSFTYPGKILESVQQREATVFPGVPTLYAMLIAMHRKSPLCLPSVQRVTNTAAALPAEYLKELQEIFPNALIFKMYGLTECKRVCYLEPELLWERPRSVGKAIPGTEVLLLSPDGDEVPTGEPGILHVRGPHVMRGYLNLPESTARMLKPGPLPWEPMLCTGDWFRMDDEGFLYFIGRSDDIIKSRGEKVSPVEVENCLHAMPGIREAAVVGVQDAVLGQAIRAVVAVEADAALDARSVQRWCAAHLENFMVPQQILFVPELPKGQTGKIAKTGLAELPYEAAGSGRTEREPNVTGSIK